MPTVADLFAEGLRCHNAGDLAKAEQLYHLVLHTDPNHADSHHLLGALALQRGQFDQAATKICHALTLNPAAAGYLSNLGVAYEGLGRLVEALACFQEAVRVQSDCAEAHCNLGKAFVRQGKLDDALAHCQRALQIRPDFPEAHNQLGNALLAKGRFSEAAACYDKALRVSPQSASFWNNLGIANDRQDKLDEAISCYHRALGLDPLYVDAWNNLSLVQMRQGQFEPALKGLGEALRVQPDYALAHWNRSVLRLLLGDYEQGWPEYEWRWAEHSFARRQFDQPLWNGSDLSGRTILLHAEQGMGDCLQFIRYAALVKQRASKVIVECHVPLMRLLEKTPGIDQLVPWGSPLPAFDVQAPLLSLPGIFRTTLNNIPASVPYVFADAGLVDFWCRELAALCSRSLKGRPRLFKVGFAWQGNPKFPGDRQRSIPLAHFGCLAGVEGVQLVSLQKGPAADQLAGFGAAIAEADHSPVLDLGNRLDEASGPFMDTAAVMMNLDLVILCDSALAHLAGALGVPFWIALSFIPDWRWLLHRDDSPWYPTGRLFRQTQLGRWEDVFQRMSIELKAKAGKLASRV